MRGLFCFRTCLSCLNSYLPYFWVLSQDLDSRARQPQDGLARAGRCQTAMTGIPRNEPRINAQVQSDSMRKAHLTKYKEVVLSLVRARVTASDVLCIPASAISHQRVQFQGGHNDIISSIQLSALFGHKNKYYEYTWICTVVLMQLT